MGNFQDKAFRLNAYISTIGKIKNRWDLKTVAWQCKVKTTYISIFLGHYRQPWKSHKPCASDAFPNGTLPTMLDITWLEYRFQGNAINLTCTYEDRNTQTSWENNANTSISRLCGVTFLLQYLPIALPGIHKHVERFRPGIRSRISWPQAMTAWPNDWCRVSFLPNVSCWFKLCDSSSVNWMGLVLLEREARISWLFWQPEWWVANVYKKNPT